MNSSELRLSEASLRPLLMELLSSQLQQQSQREAPCPAVPCHRRVSLPPNCAPQPRATPGAEPQLPFAWRGADAWQPWLAPAQPHSGFKPPQFPRSGPHGGVLWTEGTCAAWGEHHRHSRQHRGRHRAPRDQPHRGGQEDSWKGQGPAGTTNSPTPQPPPFLGQLPLAAPAPAGDIGTSAAPGQLLRAGGAAERARAHLRGCHSARAAPASTAAFQQDEHGPFQVSGSVGQGGPRSPPSPTPG